MSKLLEHTIKRLIFEQEDSGYWFKLLSDKSLRGMNANALAQQLGAYRAAFVVAKAIFKTASQDIEAIITDVVEFLKESDNIFNSTYNDGDHTYIFQTIKSRPRKKTFIMLIDQRQKYEKLIKMIKTAEARDGYFITTPNADVDMLNKIPIWSGDEYRIWRNGLDKAIQTIEARSKESGSNIDTAIVSNIKKEYEKIKFIDVASLAKTDVPDVEATETIVDLNQDGFSGKARKIIDATGKTKYIPIEGIQSVVIRNTDIKGTFEGKFAENGMPEKGTVIWNAAQKGSNFGGVKTFRGTLYTFKDDVAFQQQTIEDPQFTFSFKEGLFEYWSGHRYRGAYISAENQAPTGQGFLDHGTSIADRNTITKTYNMSDKLDFISVIEKEIGSGYDIALPYVIGTKILFKGSFNPMPQNGSLLYKSTIQAWGDDSIIGTYEAGKFTIDPDFKTTLDEAKQEIDAIKIFEDETGDLRFISIKSGADLAFEVSIPKSEVKDLTLIKKFGDQGFYEFSYMNTDLNKRYPTPGKYTYQLNITDKLGPNNNVGLTAEFIELQKALGNIK
jgi:hypothetical protein|tara:strand:- start:302 stop:1975 length:1674 start_codon:yes stop_codon:yes gene_type:complete